MPRLSFVSGLLSSLLLLGLASCTSAPEGNADSGNVATSSGTAAANGNGATPSRVAAVARSAAIVGSTRTFSPARNAYVLLSGGGTPISNNYSQYLQARAMAAFFEREFPPESTWVFFGIGNREGEPPILADARRELKRDGLIVESWLPGPLKHNRPATRESFLRALREEILPTVRGGGTLYLFVGDHGELAGSDDKRESAITMWQLKRSTRRRSVGWTSDDDEILGVAELRQVLAEGLGEGRVVFGMTQCHGGGFHELGVARDMSPPREWFSGAPPAWAAVNAPGLRLRVAGFTATDEASTAAGCDADPDPELWAGYERFLPESLVGFDLMTGAAKGRPARSLAEAHEAATLIDRTIDKPRSSSEHYLEAWARLIETKLASAPQLTSATRTAVAAFEQAVDRGRVSVTDDALSARQAQFERFTRQLVEQAPASKDLLLTGTRQQLEAAIRGRGDRGGGRGNRRGTMAELRRVWTETLRPAWKAAVLGGNVRGLSGAALEFEKKLLKIEDGGRDFLLPRGGDDTPLMEEIYWSSGYAHPATLDLAKAEAVARWGAERRPRIIAWAKNGTNPHLRAAAEKIGPGPAFVEEPARPLSRKTAAERVLFYRRVLAAWQFLVAMRAETALTELRTLIELEHTPLRPTAVARGSDQ
jgi:hypothetical protein